jgi:hypothetical protein
VRGPDAPDTDHTYSHGHALPPWLLMRRLPVPGLGTGS